MSQGAFNLLLPKIFQVTCRHLDHIFSRNEYLHSNKSNFERVVLMLRFLQAFRKSPVYIGPSVGCQVQVADLLASKGKSYHIIPQMQRPRVYHRWTQTLYLRQLSEHHGNSFADYKMQVFFFQAICPALVCQRILTDTVQILKNLPSLVQCGI